jgi:hypothetical protein
MKMENEIAAEMDGAIEKVHVTPGHGRQPGRCPGADGAGTPGPLIQAVASDTCALNLVVFPHANER